MTEKYHQLQNPQTGSVCEEIISRGTHQECLVSHDNFWDGIKWESGAALALTMSISYSLFNKKTQVGKINNGIAAPVSVISLLLSDITYKIYTRTDKVENITLPMSEVIEYNRFAKESADNWRSISHSIELQNTTINTFMNLESRCQNVYHTDIVSPAPVSAILAHGEECYAPNISGATPPTTSELSILYDGG